MQQKSHSNKVDAAIVSPISKFDLQKLDVLIPHNLEICWGMLRPKSEHILGIKEIIVASFYSPPRSKKKSKLLDHILATLHSLFIKYPNLKDPRAKQLAAV